MPRRLIFALLALVLGLTVLTTVGCGRERPSDAVQTTGTDDLGAFEEEGLSGKVRADGSSTLGPFVTFAAEQFRKEEPDVRVSVGVSGTGGGFERFCAGETDISNASRPIKDEEKEACKRKQIDYLELHVVNDGLSIVVNPQNDWADCLTVDHLKRVWQPGSKVRNWQQIDPKFPDQRLVLFGPGTDSGTFDYFTDAIVGEEGASRTDYSASEDDNVVVQGVAGEKGGLGYVGLSYLEQNAGKLRGVGVDGGDGCVEPSGETVQDGTYKPLSRPLFVYANREALERPQVEAFLQFMLDNEPRLAKGALFVALTEDQLNKAQATLGGAAEG